MQIRKAISSEAEAIYNLGIDTFRRINSRDYSANQIKAWINYSAIERVKKGIALKAIIVYVNDQDDILGFGARLGNEIQGLYVSADHQREGIGSKLLFEIEKEAILEGISEMVFQSTLTALAFYISKGYQEIRKDNWPLADSVSLQTVLIKKKLKTG